MDELLSIGTFARACGLSVSALRFYDKEGVLVPAVVDATTGYRRYHPSQLPAARLVAGMRRIGMPLAEIGVVLEQRADSEAVEQILSDHLRRLEDGLTDARREVERLRAQLSHASDPAPGERHVRVPAAELLRAIDTVRHAVGSDPDFPVLAGILVELDGDVCRLVATDRYRLTIAVAPTLCEENAIGDPEGSSGAPETSRSAALVVPSDFARGARELLARGVEEATSSGDGNVAATLHLRHDHLELRIGAETRRATALEGDFPDYRRLLHGVETPRTEMLELDRIRADLAQGRAGARHTDDVVLLGRHDDGVVLLPGASEEPAVAVNREFLLQAADAIPGAQLHLDLDGPITPLVIRSASDEHTLSLLMPVRTDA